jgi:hypothetical protein
VTVNKVKCFILGGGPSLRGLDFSTIQDHYTLGINKAFLYYPVSACFAMDYKFYRWLHTSPEYNKDGAVLAEHWQRFSGEKYLILNSEEQLVDHADDPSYHLIKRLEQPALSYSLTDGIYTGNNSGVGGLTLAIALGFREIYLLGYDMKVDHDNHQSHWHDGYPPPMGFNEVDHYVKTFSDSFAELAKLIHQAGIKVINLNPDSALPYFPKAATWA